VLGYDAQQESQAVHQRTDVLPDAVHLFDVLTARQHLWFAIESKNADDDPEVLLDRVGLTDAADRKVGDYSKGMTQRLLLAMALVGEPELLILDEPSSGFDPNGAREMREVVREEANRGATIFFSSHILDQVEAVCDRVGILTDGRLVAEDSVQNLRNRLGSESILRVSTDDVTSQALDALRSLSGVSHVSVNGHEIAVSCTDEVQVTIPDVLRDAGATINRFDTERAPLEDLLVRTLTLKHPLQRTPRFTRQRYANEQVDGCKAGDS
jgi:ABC-2 type transport system ATP-binding protein